MDGGGRVDENPSVEAWTEQWLGEFLEAIYLLLLIEFRKLWGPTLFTI